MEEESDRSVSERVGSVLLVEDHHIAAQVGHDILRGLSHRVDIAYTGLHAFSFCQRERYDFIFMDIGLPDTDGCRVAEKIRAYEREHDFSPVPIVALTAHVSHENRQACLDAGMQRVLIKPLTAQKAQEVFEDLLNWSSIGDLDTTSSISGKIIDFQAGIRLADGNVELAKRSLQMLVEGLPDDIERLETFYDQKDWVSFESAIRQLRGGACYCGVPRLEQACKNLHDCLTQKTYDRIEWHYHNLQHEIDVLSLAWRDSDWRKN